MRSTCRILNQWLRSNACRHSAPRVSAPLPLPPKQRPLHGPAGDCSSHAEHDRSLAGSLGTKAQCPDCGRPCRVAGQTEPLRGRPSVSSDRSLTHRTCGHSSGGAVAFEAVARSQKDSFPAQAVCLLDAVPWESTLHMARRFKPMPVCSLRSDPSPINLLGRVQRLLDRLSFPVEDIWIRGASHSDPENPTSPFVQLLAGLSRPEYQALYQKTHVSLFSGCLWDRAQGSLFAILPGRPPGTC